MSFNIKLNIPAGGIFSKYMFGIQNATAINEDFNAIYFNNVDNRFGDEYLNPFDFVINQITDTTYKIYDATNRGTYTNTNQINNSPNLNKYRKVVSKIKFTNELEELVNDNIKKLGIDENTIGVHVRLTDMNIIHKNDYGIINIDNYLNSIKTNINDNNTLFIASDNHQSIEKIKDLYGNRVKYLPNLLRGNSENENTLNLQLDNAKDKRLWVEAFLEMLLISKCSKIICRTSNLANAAIIHSNNSKIIRV